MNNIYDCPFSHVYDMEQESHAELLSLLDLCYCCPLQGGSKGRGWGWGNPNASCSFSHVLFVLCGQYTVFYVFLMYLLIIVNNDIVCLNIIP